MLYSTDSAVKCEEILNSIPDLISLQDANQVIVKANTAFKNHYGREGTDVEGTLCFKIVHNGVSPCANCPHVKALKSGQAEKNEYFDAASRKYFDVICTPVFGPEGAATHTIHVMRDITERKKADQQRVLNERFHGALEMAGATCHELNQPLQAVLGYMELLIKHSANPVSCRKWADLVNEQVHRMADITHRLNSITRYEVQDYLCGTKIVDLKKASETV